MKLFLSLCFLLSFHGYVYSQLDESTWSYSGDTNGPALWHTTTGGELCDGSMQSPINIVSEDTEVIELTTPWIPTGFFIDNGARPQSITNTGLRAQLNLEGDYTLSGAGLPSIMKVIQLEFHVGADQTRGSEHTIDGKQYAGELHLVMYDSVNYPDYETALSNPQGVAKSAWFFEEVDDNNDYYDPVIEALSEIKYAGSSYEFQDTFQVLFLLGFENFRNFYRYNGSLNYPGCQETVIWSVFNQTVKLSSEQLDAFRSLSKLSEESSDGQEDPLVDNFRPVQPVNGRKVYNAFYILIEESDSCSDRCNNQLDENFPCQCNSACSKYGDCCEDYRDQCLVEVCSLVHTYSGKMRKQRPLM